MCVGKLKLKNGSVWRVNRTSSTTRLKFILTGSHSVVFRVWSTRLLKRPTSHTKYLLFHRQTTALCLYPLLTLQTAELASSSVVLVLAPCMTRAGCCRLFYNLPFLPLNQWVHFWILTNLSTGFKPNNQCEIGVQTFTFTFR